MTDILGLIKMAYIASLASPEGLKNVTFFSVCVMARVLVRNESFTPKEPKTEDRF